MKGFKKKISSDLFFSSHFFWRVKLGEDKRRWFNLGIKIKTDSDSDKKYNWIMIRRESFYSSLSHSLYSYSGNNNKLKSGESIMKGRGMDKEKKSE